MMRLPEARDRSYAGTECDVIRAEFIVVPSTLSI